MTSKPFVIFQFQAYFIILNPLTDMVSRVRSQKWPSTILFKYFSYWDKK